MTGRSWTWKSVPATTKVLGLLCLMYGITYIDRVNVSTAAPVFGKELGLSNTQVGLVFSAFAYPYLVFQIFGGWVGDRYGARLALTVSAVIWGLSTLLAGLVTSLTGMLVMRVALGFGEGATFPVATRAMSDWTPASKRGFAQGITHSAARLGNALTPPLVAWLIALFTWRGSFVALGIVSLVWATVWGVYFRDSPAEHPGITGEELDRLPKFRSSAERLKVPVPWAKLSAGCCPSRSSTSVTGGRSGSIWPGFRCSFSTATSWICESSALFSAGVFFGGVLGDALGGVVSDRIYESTRDRNRARRNLVVFGFLASLSFMVPILFVHNVTVAARLPEHRVLLLRVHDRSDVGHPDGYRAEVCGIGQRADEHRLRAGRHRVSVDCRLRH